MKTRRDLLVWLSSAALAPLALAAQQRARVHRVGFLSSGPQPPQPKGSVTLEAFVVRMRELGYVEGRNLVLELRYAAGDTQRLADLAAELARIPVDVIVATTTTSTAAARKVTRTIPIVMGSNANPHAAGLGLVDSLARPGGNVTGLTLETSDVTSKRLELLKELIPSLQRIGALYPGELRSFPTVVQWLHDNEAAARALGVTLRPYDLGFDQGRWDKVFRNAAADGMHAVTVIETSTYLAHRASLARHALQHRIPTAFPFREQAEEGGLMAYGADVVDLYRRAAEFVDRILKGANPGELPVEQPTKFTFAVNRKTADALGVRIPQSILLRAEIIQ